MEQIDTKRLLLRAWKIEDCEDMYEYSKSFNVGPNAGWKPHENVEESKKIIESFIEEGNVFAIALKENNKVIGSIGIHNHKSNDNYKEIGYVLNENYWNKGYMSECVKAVIQYIFTKMNVNIIGVGHFSYNMASKGVIIKNGFKYEGILRQYVKVYNGKIVDLVHYSMTKEEWENKNFNNVILTIPKIEHKQKALQYKQEHFNNNEFAINGDGGLDEADSYEEWLIKIQEDMIRDNGVLVPATTYFGMIDEEIVGTLQIRHKLNDYLIQYGGHIGYSVAPSQRKKGYATSMLKKALEICKKMGLRKILITCNSDNIPSAKTIIKCGGIFENEIEYENNKLKRFWINLY